MTEKLVMEDSTDVNPHFPYSIDLYCYDSLGRLIRSSEIHGSETRISTWHQYNGDNRLSQQSYQIGGSTFSESYTYNSADGSMATMTTASGNTLTYAYDGLNRLQSVTGPYTKTYAYRTVSGSQTTGQIASLTYGGFSNAPAFTYSYTADGNIAAESGANGSWTYRYDNQGQLTQAVNGSTTYSYAYDAAGNILSANGNTYTYGNAFWADLLTAYNGHAIAYEGQTLTSETSATGTVVSGNPVSYYNGTRWNFTWEGSRRLTSASSGGNTISFTYDVNGLRTSKTVNGTLHTYYYAGGKLLRETYGNNVLDFAYDASGNPFSLTYNGTKYYYITNTQGDVFYLINTAGTVVASYTYDPYGKVLSETGSLATVNPLRYRGYYYDTESGFYYLQSRYYDPQICRFINADFYAVTGQGFVGCNMFVYCGNNPAMRADSDGEAWVLVGLITVGLLLLSGCSSDSEPAPEPEQPKPNVEPISSYGDGTGNVYIVTEDKVAEIESNISDTDVIIVDYRTNTDPDMQIKQSYKIGKEAYQKEIAQIMINYNSQNPVNPAWDRSLNSLVDEWRFHNFAYSIGYKRERTADTDFNNNDEGKGFWDFVWR